MTALRHVTALIDWDTARRLASSLQSGSRRHFDALFDKLQVGIARYITAIDRDSLYRVKWRLYHGWYRGRTKTEDRIAVEKYLFTVRSRTIMRVSFGTDFAFSEILCCDSRRNPIVDTLRFEQDTQTTRQKMVDSSLVCDLLHLVRCRDSDLYIIVGNDDDFLPALFTAEAWRAKAILLHNRDYVNSHLNLNGLVVKIGVE